MSVYECLSTSGPVSIKPLTFEMIPKATSCFFYILMGPTGTGKSNFIEVLSSGGKIGPQSISLGIAKDQLSSVTQKTTMYELENVSRFGVRVVIVDTPGFGDPKLSETSIMDGLRSWGLSFIRHNKHHRAAFFWFDRIMDIRITRSQKQCIQMMFEAMGVTDTASQSPSSAISPQLITTMWDMLCNEKMRARADARFEALETVVWKRIFSIHTQEYPLVLKFNNTFDSAMLILDSLPAHAPRPHMRFLDGGYELYTYTTLRDRFFNQHQRLRYLKDDVNSRGSDSAGYLRGIQDETEDDLLRFGLEIESIQKRMERHLPASDSEVPGYLEDPDYKWYYVPRNALVKSLRQDMELVYSSIKTLQASAFSRKLRTIQRNVNLDIREKFSQWFR